MNQENLKKQLEKIAYQKSDPFCYGNVIKLPLLDNAQVVEPTI